MEGQKDGRKEKKEIRNLQNTEVITVTWVDRAKMFFNPILFFRKLENLINLLVNDEIVTYKMLITT